MSANAPIKKPNLVWPILSFAATILLFVVFNDSLDENWHLLVLFLGSDIVGLMRYFQQKASYARMEQMNESQAAVASGINRNPLAKAARITVTREGSMLGAAVATKVYLNGAYIGDIKNGKQLSFDTMESHNTVTFFDGYGNPYKDDVTMDISEEGNAEIFVKAGKVLTDQTRIVLSSPLVSSLASQGDPASQPLQYGQVQAIEEPSAQPENPAWAFWAMIFAFLFIVIGAFSFNPSILRSYAITDKLVSLSYALILGASAYLLSRSATKSKVISLCGLLLTVLLYPLSTTYLGLTARSLQAPPIAALFQSGQFTSSLRGTAIITVIFGVAAMIIMAVHKGPAKKKLNAMAWTSAAAVLVWRLYNLRYVFTLPQYSPFQRAGLILSAIDGSVCIALFALLIWALCNQKHKELHTGTGAKVWFSLCVIFTIGAAIASISSGALGVAGATIAIVGVSGYVLLLASRRAGFPIILMVVLMNVISGVSAGLLGYRPSVANALSPLIGFINPLITWWIIHSRWNENSHAANRVAVSAAETEKANVNIAFKIAAIVNILAGGVLFAAAIYAMIDTGRYIWEAFVFGAMLGSVLIGLGIAAAVQSFGKKTKVRMWLQILQLVIACLCLVTIVVGFISSTL